MSILRMTLLILAALWVSHSTDLMAAVKEGSTIVLKLREHSFRVPERYSRETAIPSWLRWLPGIDDASKDYVEQDKTVRENVMILLAALSEDEVARYKDPNRPPGPLARSR
jgi:hypothetical protein